MLRSIPDNANYLNVSTIDNSYNQTPSSSTQNTSDAPNDEMLTEGYQAPPTSSPINSSEEKVDTSAGQSVKQSLLLPELDFFCGSLGDQEIQFARQKVPKDGECGFNALEINRSDLRDVLIGLSDRQDILERLCEEVYEAFFTNKIECTSEFTSLKDRYHRRLDRLGQSLRDVRERNPEMPAFALESDARAVISNSIQWLRENDKTEDAELVQQALSKKEDANTALMNYCKSSEAYRLYCEAYLKGLWLGCESAKIYAEQNHFRLFIWERPSNQDHLYLRHRTDSNQPKDRHLIFLNGNHFDRLFPIPFVKVQDRSPSPSPASTSIKAVEVAHNTSTPSPKRIFDVVRDIFNPIKEFAERYKVPLMKCFSEFETKILDLVHKVSKFAAVAFFAVGLMMVIIHNPAQVLSYNYGFCATAVFLITSSVHMVIYIIRNRAEERVRRAEENAKAEAKLAAERKEKEKALREKEIALEAIRQREVLAQERERKAEEDAKLKIAEEQGKFRQEIADRDLRNKQEKDRIKQEQEDAIKAQDAAAKQREEDLRSTLNAQAESVERAAQTVREKSKRRQTELELQLANQIANNEGTAGTLEALTQHHTEALENLANVEKERNQAAERATLLQNDLERAQTKIAQLESTSKETAEQNTREQDDLKSLLLAKGTDLANALGGIEKLEQSNSSLEMEKGSLESELSQVKGVNQTLMKSFRLLLEGGVKIINVWEAHIIKLQKTEANGMYLDHVKSYYADCYTLFKEGKTKLDTIESEQALPVPPSTTKPESDLLNTVLGFVPFTAQRRSKKEDAKKAASHSNPDSSKDSTHEMKPAGTSSGIDSESVMSNLSNSNSSSNLRQTGFVPQSTGIYQGPPGLASQPPETYQRPPGLAPQSPGTYQGPPGFAHKSTGVYPQQSGFVPESRGFYPGQSHERQQPGFSGQPSAGSQPNHSWQPGSYGGQSRMVESDQGGYSEQPQPLLRPPTPKGSLPPTTASSQDLPSVEPSAQTPAEVHPDLIDWGE